MKNIFEFDKRKTLFPAALLALLLCGPAARCSDGGKTVQTPNNSSRRCSLTEPRMLAGFNEGTDGFMPGENVSSLELIDRFPNWPHRLHEGSACLKANSPVLAADRWRTVYKEFPEGLDLKETPVIEFGVNTTGGGASADYYVRLTLSDGTRSFESIAKAAPNEWCVTIFDLNACPFLDDIRRLEIGLMNDSDRPWENADFEIDGLRAGRPLDLTFDIEGSAALFSADNGQVAQNGGTLEFSFGRGGRLTSPILTGSRNHIYDPPLGAANVTYLPHENQNMSYQTRNTLFFVMENRSSADKVRIGFITNEDGTYDPAKSKIFDIAPNSPKRAYYFNLSDITQARGRIAGFRVEPIGGTGSLIIDRISFEEEPPAETFAGKITSCTASGEKITVEGRIDPRFVNSFSRLAVYETDMYRNHKFIGELTPLYEGPVSERFTIDSIPLKNGRMTRLSSQLLAVVKNGDDGFLKVAPEFYIENWRDFGGNPYAFGLPERQADVLDYGARGDGFTDDTKAIQAAIDAVSAQGGGRVILSGNDAPEGRRYIATHLMLKSNVELHIGKGAVLWQSQREADYPYTPVYGHDIVIPNVPWTHCLYVNPPLIQAKEVENIKITGAGKIRMADVCSIDPHLEHYARTCTDRIHLIPIGFWKVRNAELSDFEIVRCNNYHMSFYFSENIYVGNIRMHEVKCVSGDGVSLSMGTHDVKIDRIFLESNDDGIVLTSSYGDPRGGWWWWEDRQDDHAVYNVEVVHSYINSGGGKAISLIPWGTTNPDQRRQEMRNVKVTDCVLMGGYAVGTWPDNPFDGKPFDNTERDDYVPIKDFIITDNEYRSPCDLLWVQPTNFVTDCGIRSSSVLRNGDFALGHCYWSMEGEAGADNGTGYARNDGRLYEGLYLGEGGHTLSAEVKGTGELFIEDASTGERIGKLKFKTEAWKNETLTAEIGSAGTFRLGITGGDADIRKVRLDGTHK